MPVSGSTYDEFALLEENASEAGLPWRGRPPVRRLSVELPGGRRQSALLWGSSPAEPELVLLHGGAQNAHTWDTVVLALGRPALAIDLAGHGHSDWREAHDYSTSNMADDVAVTAGALAPNARLVVGMSLGGLTSLGLAARHPDRVPRLTLVDVTPGVNAAKAKAIVDFVSGPERFATFDDILARTIEHNPTRTEASLRRGVLHNAVQQADGTWTWRWDPNRGDASSRDAAGESRVPDSTHLWDAVEGLRVPTLLARGGVSPVVDDDDVTELLRRRPDARVVVVDGAGHSIQGDRPVELAALIEAELQAAG
jgi:pimeloyl-ACP methyl ester carboxylesterase